MGVFPVSKRQKSVTKGLKTCKNVAQAPYRRRWKRPKWPFCNVGGLAVCYQRQKKQISQALVTQLEFVQQAVQKAEELTQSAGVTLGRLVYISESSSTPIYSTVEAARADFAGATSFAPTRINAGESEIQVTVQAVFAIQ